MADKLTPQQHAAVTNRGGKLLVSAAAGSGKTKVLVDRLLSYLTDPVNPADLDSFLIITYTKAAATELRAKIASKLAERIAQEPGNRHLQKQMQRLFLTKISTVHGFCGDILREYAYRLDIPADFRVADEVECREIRDQVLGDILDHAYSNDENSDFRAFADSQGLGRSDKLIPQIIESVYDSSRCHLDPEKWIQNCMEAASVSGLDDAGKTVWGDYLIKDLFAYLDKQIFAVHKLLSRANEYPEFEKVSLNLRVICVQLEELRNCASWDSIVNKRNIDYGRLTFPRKNNPDLDLTEQIKAVRSACKKGMERKLHSFSDPSKQILQDLQQAESSVRGLIQLVKEFDTAYAAAKKRRRCLDFADLEHHTLTLLLGKSRSGATAAAAEIGSRYREIMVDEYQDSNGVQDAIFHVLTEKRQNCFMVGDVKQSIYQFRLADPGIFLNKYHTYLSDQDAAEGQGRKILLSDNFRSGCEVIEAVNDVFYCCMKPETGGLLYTSEEALREGIPHTALPEPAVEFYTVDVKEETYPEEAEFVADKIQTMLSSGTLIRSADGFRPVTPEDIVILLRSPGSGGIYFQRALETRGIRCVSGSGMNLLKTQEVATIRSLLQTIQNPRQDIPLISTLASPVFGFTADTLGIIRSKNKKGTFYDALLNDSSQHTMQFLQVLSVLREYAQKSSLTALLEKCINLTRMDSIYGAMPGGKTKVANLQMFFQLAVDFENGSVRDLSQFLEHLNALEVKGVSAAGASPSSCVTIMSIHKSKGLEFPVVFLCNLSRKFNQENLRAQILCDRTLGIGLSIADTKTRIRYPSVAKRAIAVKMSAESISEEMRVLYVALTRARDRLIMTYASKKPEEDIKEIVLRSDSDHGELVCLDANCPGHWILLAAIGKTEAGQLHAIGGRPSHTKVSNYPWKIAVEESKEYKADSQTEDIGASESIPNDTLNRLRSQLDFRYAHQAATLAPSKQTATGRKGRIKDEEASSNTMPPRQRYRNWRKPTFVKESDSPTAYGNAMHKALQGISFAKCKDVDSVRDEIHRLLESEYLTPEQAKLISADKLAAFFQTDIGRKLISGVPHIREFKFSILDDASNYGDALQEEFVLLQGVVDCALLEPDGVTVVDFKTDRVTEDTLPDAVARYTPQVEAYAGSISRIYQQKIKGKYLYFFQLDRFVSL